MPLWLENMLDMISVLNLLRLVLWPSASSVLGSVSCALEKKVYFAALGWNILYRSIKSMFIAALFTIARTWKQPKCPLTEEWIKKMWHTYTMEYYSAIKGNEIELFVVRWMDLESVIQSEVSQKEKNKYHMLTYIYEI